MFAASDGLAGVTSTAAPPLERQTRSVRAHCNPISLSPPCAECAAKKRTVRIDVRALALSFPSRIAANVARAVSATKLSPPCPLAGFVLTGVSRLVGPAQRSEPLRDAVVKHAAKSTAIGEENLRFSVQPSGIKTPARPRALMQNQCPLSMRQSLAQVTVVAPAVRPYEPRGALPLRSTGVNCNVAK